jgi:AcrR family transcriptional regulator
MAPKQNGVKRKYDATGRQAIAQRRRDDVLDAAQALFMEAGYAATTMAAIAQRAGVNVDTVYSLVGAKPLVLRALNERTVTGSGTPAPVEEWHFVERIHNEPDAVGKLTIYAEAVSAIRPKQVPLFLIAKDAASVDDDIAREWAEGSRKRATNLLQFAQDLESTGRLRPGMTIELVRDIIWATSTPEMWLLLVGERGWDGAQFAAWLIDTWTRTLLVDL